MKKKPEGFLSMPLWQKGLFLILVGPLTNLVMTFVFPIVGNSGGDLEPSLIELERPDRGRFRAWRLRIALMVTVANGLTFL